MPTWDENDADPSLRVTLYESAQGRLFLARGDQEWAWDTSPDAEPRAFESDAVALFDDDTEEWTLERVPLSALDAPGTRAVAVYHQDTGHPVLYRDAATGLPVAGDAARRYVGPALERDI